MYEQLQPLIESTHRFVNTRELIHSLYNYSHLPRTARDQMRSALVQSAYELRYINSNILGSDGLMVTADQIADHLCEQGFRKLRYVGLGGSTLVFEAGGNQVIRLMLKDRVASERLEHPAILQNITESFVDAPHCSQLLHIEVQPKLIPYEEKSYNNPAYEKIQHELAKAGIMLDEDMEKHEQYGILPDGTALIWERNVLGRNPDHPMLDLRTSPPPCPDISSWLLPSDQCSVIHGVPAGYISKQEHYYPALHDHRVRDALSDADIERLRNGELELLRHEKPESLKGITPKNLDGFIDLVQAKGNYPSEAQNILARQQPSSNITSPVIKATTHVASNSASRS